MTQSIQKIMDNAGVQENYEDYDNVPEIYAVDYEPYYNTLYISGNKLGMQTGNVYIQTTAGRKLIPAEDIIQWSESGIRLKIRDGSIGNIIIETYDCKFSNEDISIGNSELLSKYLLREDFESAAEGELQASVWDVSVSAKASIQTKSEQKLMELKGNNPNLEVTWLGGTGSSRRFGNNITTFDFQFPNGSSSYNGLYNLLRQSSAGTKYTLDVRPSYSPAFSLEQKGLNEERLDGKSIQAGKWYTCKTMILDDYIYLAAWEKGKDEPEYWDIRKVMADTSAKDSLLNFSYYDSDGRSLYIDNIEVVELSGEFESATISAVDYDPIHENVFISGSGFGAVKGEVVFTSDNGKVTLDGADILSWNDELIHLKKPDNAVEGTVYAVTGEGIITNKNINLMYPSKSLAFEEDFTAMDMGALSQSEEWDVTVGEKALVTEYDGVKVLELTGNAPNLDVTLLDTTTNERRVFGDNITTFDFQFPSGSASYMGMYNLLRDSKQDGIQYTLDIRPKYGNAPLAIEEKWSGGNEAQLNKEIKDAVWYTCKTMVKGNYIYLKAWERGTPEPEDWDIYKRMRTANDGECLLNFSYHDTDNSRKVIISNVAVEEFKEEVTVSYKAGIGGIISGSADQRIAKYTGTTTEVTAVADAGYKFKQWSDGKTTATRTDTDITNNVTFTAVFEKKAKVTYAAGHGGSIEGTLIQQIDKNIGITTEVTAVAEEGYIFKKWSDGKKTASRTDTGITSDVTFTAVFEKKVKVTYEAGEGGSIEGIPVQQIVQNTGITTEVAAIADDGYKFTQWSDGRTTTSRTDTGIASDVTFMAEFEKIIKISKIILNPTSKNLKPGESFTIEVTVEPIDATNKAVSFDSSNSAIATVSGNKVTAKATGTATITATAQDGSGMKAAIKVTVQAEAKLAEPKSVKAVQTSAKAVKVTWSKVTGAKQYDVYRSAKVSSGFRKIGTATVTSYKDKKATPGKTWYYKVVAVSRIAGNNSAMSGAARISMLKKPSIKVKSMNSGQVTVKWNKIKGVKGYQIYVSTKKTGGLKKKLTLMKASKVKSTVKKLKSGRKYYFKVRAYKKINGKKIYGAFSKAKGIEVK